MKKRKGKALLVIKLLHKLARGLSFMPRKVVLGIENESFFESLLIRVKEKLIMLEKMAKEAETFKKLLKINILFVQVFGQPDWQTCIRLFPPKTESKELELWAGKLSDVVSFDLL